MHVRTDDLTWRKVADDIILLDLRRSTYLRLNPTGAILWERIVEGDDEQRLVSAVVDRFGATPERAASDVRSFLAQLRDSDLLV